MRVWERLHAHLRTIRERKGAEGHIDEHDNLVFLALFKEVHALQAFKLAHNDAARAAHEAAEREAALAPHPNVVDLTKRHRYRPRRQIGGAA